MDITGGLYLIYVKRDSWIYALIGVNVFLIPEMTILKLFSTRSVRKTTIITKVFTNLI